MLHLIQEKEMRIMFIKKSQYLALKDHLEEEKKKSIMLQERIDALETLSRLKEKEKASNNIEKLLRKQDYQYAILVKEHTPIVYNDGRIEKGVRSIEFEAHYDEIPAILIEK